MNGPTAPHFTREELRQIFYDLNRIPTGDNANARNKLMEWIKYDNDPSTQEGFLDPHY